MPDILPGFTWDRSVARYRDTTRGQFVSRQRITGLLDIQINTAEQRLGNLVTALHEQRISPGVFQEQMRTELRRLHLQNAALGSGGFERLGAREYGRAGQMLRGDYGRLTNLANDIVNGRATLPQALNRVHGYVGTARVNFLEAERDAQRTAAQVAGEVLIMIRTLGPSEHCRSCVDYHQRGWQYDLPSPGTQSECLSNCRCNLRYRTVTVSQAAELIGTRA